MLTRGSPTDRGEGVDVGGYEDVRQDCISVSDTFSEPPVSPSGTLA